MKHLAVRHKEIDDRNDYIFPVSLSIFTYDEGQHSINHTSKKKNHLVWGNQVGLEISPPLESALYALLGVFEFPLRSTHVPFTCVRLVEPALFPDVIRIRFRQGYRLRILSNITDYQPARQCETQLTPFIPREGP